MATLQSSGFSVPVMQSVNFADGAQLAGRGPENAGAGFDTGIGVINALRNTRQKSILAPIEADTAKARLAQIQAQTQLEQAMAPYRNALARIEVAKASLPQRVSQGVSIQNVPETDINGQPTGRFHEVLQENGIQFDPTTGTTQLFSANVKPLRTAQQIASDNALAQSRTLQAQTAAGNAGTRATLAAIAQQNADTAAQRQAAYAQGIAGRVSHLQALEARGTHRIVQSQDANGNLVLNPINVATGQMDQAPIVLNTKPIAKADDFLTTAMKNAPAAAPAAPAQPGPIANGWNWVKSKFGAGTPDAAATPTTLPNIPANPTAAPAAQAAPMVPSLAAPLAAPAAGDDTLTDDDLDDLLSGVAQAAPAAAPAAPNAFQVGKYSVRVK